MVYLYIVFFLISISIRLFIYLFNRITHKKLTLELLIDSIILRLVYYLIIFIE